MKSLLIRLFMKEFWQLVVNDNGSTTIIFNGRDNFLSAFATAVIELHRIPAS